MSVDTQNTEQNPISQADFEAVKVNRDEILSEKKELKGKFDAMSSQFEAMQETIKNLGSLVGVQEGEDVTTKAKELIQAKEKEAFDKMSDIEKLNLRLETLEGERNEARTQAELKTKEALGLRIDEKLKTELTKAGVNDPNNVALGLDVLKVRNSIQGMEGESLVLGDGSNIGVDSLVSNFLEGNKALISNPSRNGSGFTGGKPINVEALSQKEALENARKTGKYSNVISQQLAQLQGN